MSTGADGSRYADAQEHRQLGHDVQDVLHTLVDRAQDIGTGSEEDEKGRALYLGKLAARKLSGITHMAEGMGSLCPRAEQEFMMAEAVIAAMSVKALTWGAAGKNEPTQRPGSSTEAPHRCVPRGVYIEAMRCTVMSIKQAFPGNTAERWRAMAEASVGRERAETQVLL